MLLVIALYSVQCFADNDQLRVLQLREAGYIQILVISHKQIKGQILGLESEVEDEGIIYELEMFDNNGRVWEV